MTDERRDDEIIGRALSRAIETIDVNQTPYERSRIATAPARRSIFGFWQIATAAAAIVLALAIGSWLTRPTEGQPGVAASPSASVGNTPTTTATPTPGPKTTPVPSAVDHQRIYFARDGQPPISEHFESTGVPPAPEPRIQWRLSMLVTTTQVPSGSFTAFSSRIPIGVNSVSVNGNTATVDFQVNGGDWGIRGSAQSLALMQQLVYTATEEPGIRSVVITQNGGAPATIDQLRVTQPLAREDVFGYSSRGSIGTDQGISWGGDDTLGTVGADLTSVAADGSTVRLMFEGHKRDADNAKTNLPSFTISLDQDSETSRPSAVAAGAKYALSVAFQWNCTCSSGGVAGATIYDQTPLRSITSNGNTAYRVAIDDARPWRAYMPDPAHLVVEIGGDPRETSDRIAVTAPKPGAIANSGADLTLTGSARVFEANVVWRVLDSSGKVAANGHFLTSLGSSAVWGTFNTKIPMPANVRGNLTLEVYEASAKDGSAQGVVHIPLAVR
ncbi:MAG: GerMN domain-containing protein [Chloroflexota bacterium]|nr:GerMN domain-containing protein [Chloroflexota bacterium]